MESQPPQPEAPSQAAPDRHDDGPLLDLDTLIARPRIAIDGVLFEILHPSELSIIDSHRFGVWGRRIQELASEEGEKAEDELTGLVDKLARKVGAGIPDDVFARLSGAHKQAIADVFTGLLLRNRLGVAGAIAKAAGMPSTGAIFSPGSSASTAASPAGGFMKRLWRWFGLT